MRERLSFESPLLRERRFVVVDVGRIVSSLTSALSPPLLQGFIVFFENSNAALQFSVWVRWQLNLNRFETNPQVLELVVIVL
jgi:hypothetical protein